MIDTEYLTQILLTSTRKEDPVVFFRRVQKTIWESLFLFFPEIEQSGKDIYEALPWNVFRQVTHLELGLSSADFLSTRYLETAKLCAHGIRISRQGPSAYVKGASDNTVITEICIESAKMADAKFPGVRMSYCTKIQYQPFAGFYPLADKRFGTPELVKRLLEVPESRQELFPRIDQTLGKPPLFRYPVVQTIHQIATQETAVDFLQRLADPARPIPFLVFMGSDSRMMNEAKFLLPMVYTKCYVYIVDKPSSLNGIDSIVTGIDVQRNFKHHYCRVFFPFGDQYMHEDFANPHYPVRFFESRRKELREQILNGLLRFFDLDEPKWRRTQRDVHMTQLDLQVERQMQKQSDEVNNSHEALAKKQEIIDMVLEERRKEKGAFDDERKMFTEENRRLEEENSKLVHDIQIKTKHEQTLQAVNEDLERQLSIWRHSGETSDPEWKIRVESLYPGEVHDHLVFLLRRAEGQIPAEMLRHRQIISAIVKDNPPYGEMQKMQKEIEEIFNANTRLSDSNIKRMERLGFKYTKDGPHHKFTMGDFFMTIPCTTSDKGRAWKNTIRDFKRNFFAAIQ